MLIAVLQHLQDDLEKFPFPNECQDFNLPEVLNPLSRAKSSEGTRDDNFQKLYVHARCNTNRMRHQ